MMRLLAFAVLATVLAPTSSAQTIYVTTRQDTVDFPFPQTVAQLPGPDGKISFREACIAANNTAGSQTIGFQVPMTGWGSSLGPIILNKGLSFPISDDLTIVDGTTQTAFTGDSNPNGAEVSFHSTVTDPTLIATGTIVVTSANCQFIGLGNMDGRNYGIDFLSTAHDNSVTQCVIKGVFAAVRVQGHHNTIGSTLPGMGNSLSSLSDGLRIQGFAPLVAHDNVAVGNYLTGEFNGVQIVGLATNNRIGGFLPGEPNQISDAGYFQEDGTPDGAMVRIEVDATSNQILGNFIGTNATGTAASAGNIGDVGVEIYGDSNEVRGNVIGGIVGTITPLSVEAGVCLREGAEHNQIVGNWIGCDKTGTIAIPNHIGVQVGPFDASLTPPSDNHIGSLTPGDGNVIADNQQGAVRVLLTSSGADVSGNEIRDNHSGGWVGIDLGGDNATANDLGDVDTGPNALMNSPVISTVVAGPLGTVVIGKIDTQNPQNARLEFFSNPLPAPGEIVEAKTFLGSGAPLANGNFAVALAPDASTLAITVTATDANGDTSEISGPVVATASPWTDLGNGLSGATTPRLAAGGPLTVASHVALLVSSAPATAAGFWIAGFSAINAPVFGGILVPSPQAVISFTTDSSGAGSLEGFWPGAPSGTQLFVQTWVIDAGAPFGFAATNALVGTAP